MPTDRPTKELGSMLSILSIGTANPDEVNKVEESIISEAKRNKKSRRPVLELIDSADLEEASDDDIDDFFEAAMLALDDPTIMMSDIAGNVDFAIDITDDPEADLEYKNDIIGAGRKYARTTANGEASEIERAYALQNTFINKLNKELDQEKKNIDEDLKHLRGLRTRQWKAIADLETSKASMYGHQLALIKELNAMTKTQFELKAKLQANDTSDMDSLSTRTLQNIFGIGRKSMMEGINGSSSGNDLAANNAEIDEAMIERELDARLEDSDDDGDKFLKYESQGVEYVVEFDDNDDYTVYAEDRDGNRIDDYPLPGNVEDLHFTINKHSSMATDQLQRRYKVRGK